MASPGDKHATPSPAPRTSWFQLGVVSFADFIAWTGFGAIMPFLPIFLREEAHSSMWLIGVIAAMFYVGTLAFSYPLGWLSDLIGRKPVMVAGAALYTVSLLLFTTTTDPYWFAFFRLLEGVGTAAFGPAAQAFVADITSERNRSKAYGFLTTAQFGGLIAGPALAAPLYKLGGGGVDGFYAIFYFGSAAAALTMIALLVFVREPRRLLEARRERRRALREQRPAADGAAENEGALAVLRQVLSMPAILAFVVVGFTSHWAMGGFDVVWSLWLKEVGASLDYIGLTWVAFSVPMLLSFVGGVLADRYSRFWLFLIGYLISAVSWVIYGVTTNLTIFLLVNVIEGLAIAFSYPAKQAFLIQVTPLRWRGSVTGVEQSAMQAAGLLGSLTAPVIFGWISGYVLAVGGALSLLGLAVGAPVLYREWRKLAAAGRRESCEELEAPRPLAVPEPRSE
jgi:DHA1 family multidrug resistance protein-like MFS transporter